jgi:HPt (histidine-containing phosphotransfer) domain-containing protein
MTALQDQEKVEGVDCGPLLATLGGSVALLHELIDIFTGECPGYLAAIAGAIRAGDGPRLHLAAHGLCGTAANFRHRPACRSARELEDMGRRGDLTGAAEAFAALTEAVGRLGRCLLEVKSAS